MISGSDSRKEGEGVSGFTVAFCRHRRVWKWRENKPSDDPLHITTMIGFRSRTLAMASVREELARRKQLDGAASSVKAKHPDAGAVAS